ncbi:polysaccharide biosynthesis C-terminal domain-containing protein [Agrococcus sp. KRD186]|uniref:polysaccharide biosynthesis C-terminal domain-containing protein n=1 Tax=Agrococcus sp. KRD186 TaxID=2729730 RepID=UPI0019D26AF2
MRGASIPTALLFASQMVAAVAAFGVSFLAAFVMTPAERGDLALWLQLGYLATTLAMLGLERPATVHIDGNFHAVNRLQIRLLSPSIATLAALVLSVGMLAVLTGVNYTLLALIALGAVFALVSLWGRTARVSYIISGQWKPFVGITVLIQVCLLLGAGVLAMADVSGVTAWATVYVTSAAITALVLLLSGAAGRAAPASLDLPPGKLSRLGLELLPASLGNTAMLRSDRLLLPFLSSSSQLGLYVLVATATELASAPVKQYADAALRQWKRNPPTRSRFLWSIFVAGLFGAAMATCAALVCWLVISRWLPDYRESLALLPPLIVAAAIYSCTRVQQGMLIAEDRTRSASFVEVTGMVASVISYVVLIPIFGAFGAAWGSVIGYTFALLAGITAGLRGRSGGRPLGQSAPDETNG